MTLAQLLATLVNAAATLVGQNLGANQIERAEQSVLVTARYSAALMFAVTAFFLIFAEPIVSLFTTEPEVLRYGTQALKVIGSGYVAYGIAMVLTQALNGAGDSKTPTWMNFFCFWVFQTPFAYFLSETLDLGAIGAVASIPVAQTIFVVVAWYHFKKGKWKTLKV